MEVLVKIIYIIIICILGNICINFFLCKLKKIYLKNIIFYNVYEEFLINLFFFILNVKFV